MSNHLVITAVGRDRSGIVKRLTNIITEHECNIENSRMTILGGEFAIILMVSGNWNTIAKLESQLPRYGDELELIINCKRTEQRAIQPDTLSYNVEALSMDQPGIVHKVSEFFDERGINIENLNTDAYNAAHTGTPMFAMTMTVCIPATLSIARLREQFFDFCDQMNLDGIIEPARN